VANSPPETAPAVKPHHFASHLLRNSLWSLAIVVAGLAIGIAGYMTTEGWSMLDSFLNAAMILSSMGPLDHPITVWGKIFSGIYAIFSGLLFFSIAALAVAPLLHRLLHRLHVEGRERDRPHR
jgi:hypothetical protein